MASFTVFQLNTSQIAEYMIGHPDKINICLEELKTRKNYFTVSVRPWTISAVAWYNEFIAEIQKLYIFRNNLKIVFTDEQLNIINQLKSDVVGYKNMCEMTY
jgi:hypothetical protein